MKIQKTELAQKLNKIKGVVPKKTTTPVLQGVLVADGYLIANSMEMTVKAKVEGAEGETFIIPERAFDLINNLPDGEVEITANDKNVVTIKADKIKNKYQTRDPLEFPVNNAQEEGSELTIQADILLESIKRVAYAVPAQAKTQSMTAMCLHATEGQLNFVGLDGHVLAWDKVDYDGEFKLLIPKNTVDKLKSLGLSGEIQIKHNKNGAFFITEEFQVYTRLIDGDYFNYKTMFMKLSLHTVVSRMELLNAMNRAKMCTEEKRPVKFEIKDNNLNISINDNITDYSETLYLQEEMTQEITIAFDAKLVIETLKAFDCDNVGISLEGPKMPMRVEAEDSDFRAIVLPVAIK